MIRRAIEKTPSIAAKARERRGGRLAILVALSVCAVVAISWGVYRVVVGESVVISDAQYDAMMEEADRSSLLQLSPAALKAEVSVRKTSLEMAQHGGDEREIAAMRASLERAQKILQDRGVK